MKNGKYYANRSATIILNKVCVAAFAPSTPRMMHKSQIQMNMGNKVRKNLAIFLKPFIFIYLDFIMIVRADHDLV
jgi:hypothetical protein